MASNCLGSLRYWAKATTNLLGSSFTRHAPLTILSAPLELLTQVVRSGQVHTEAMSISSSRLGCEAHRFLGGGCEPDRDWTHA
jgi:hypothetical protein